MLAVFGTVWDDGQGDGQLVGRKDHQLHRGGHRVKERPTEQNS